MRHYSLVSAELAFGSKKWVLVSDRLGNVQRMPAHTAAVSITSTNRPAENPSGYMQAFSIRPDGSGLRQLTGAYAALLPDGTVRVESLGPFAYQ